MKLAAILTLPVLALAAATPQVEERQVPDVGLPLEVVECLRGVTGLVTCIGTGLDLSRLLLCPPLVVFQAFGCLAQGTSN